MVDNFNAPGTTRTCDLLIRRPTGGVPGCSQVFERTVITSSGGPGGTHLFSDVRACSGREG